MGESKMPASVVLLGWRRGCYEIVLPVVVTQATHDLTKLATWAEMMPVVTVTEPRLENCVTFQFASTERIDFNDQLILDTVERLAADDKESFLHPRPRSC